MSTVGLYQNTIRKGLNEYFGLFLIPKGTYLLFTLIPKIFYHPARWGLLISITGKLTIS